MPFTTRSVNRAVLPILVALMVCAPDARATGTDAVTAQALFDEAKALMAERRFAEACPKLEQSQELDPGGGTLLYLALCYEEIGRLATAWARYNEALSAARRDRRSDRQQAAEQKIQALVPRLAKIVIQVPSEARVKGLTIFRDETRLPEGAWGIELPTDRGERRIVASAPGYETWSRTVNIDSDGTRTVVEVPVLTRKAASVSSGQAKRPAPKSDSIPSDASTGSTQRTIGLVVGGVGVAALATGGILTALSISNKTTADGRCTLGPSGDQCDDEGFEANDRALSLGNLATVFAAAGLVLVGGGATLWLTAPKSESESGALKLAPKIAASGASVDLTARW